VAFDDQGNAYVTDGYASAIWRVTPDGEVSEWLSGKPLFRPVSIVTRDGKFLVADPWARNVFEISVKGEIRGLVQNTSQR
jgi:hypothetical protein